MERPSNARHRGRTDIALISVMRDALLRRSEAAEVRWKHIATEPEGSGRLTIPWSKTDQQAEGVGLYLGPPTMKTLDRIRPRQPPSANASPPRVPPVWARATADTAVGWAWPSTWRTPAPPWPSSKRWAAGSHRKRWPGTSGHSSLHAASSPSCIPASGRS